MTDTELKRRKAICEAAHVDEIDDVSDGFHTFRQLYYQRMMLFAAIVKQNKDKAWKSLRHEDGELCFGGGWFIVGIDTPEGSYTYHYEDNYYSLFDCEELEHGKHWDGHTEKDVTRLLSLPRTQLSQQGTTSDLISRQAAIDALADMHCKSDEDGYVWIIRSDAWARIDALPSAQPPKEISKRVLWSGWKGYRDTRYKCPNCEKPVRNDDAYCHRCGQRLLFPNISFTDYVPGQGHELIVRWDDEG